IIAPAVAVHASATRRRLSPRIATPSSVCAKGVADSHPPDRHGATGQLPVWGSTGAAGRCYRNETSPGAVLDGDPPVPEVPDGARSPGGRARARRTLRRTPPSRRRRAG